MFQPSKVVQDFFHQYVLTCSSSDRYSDTLPDTCSGVRGDILSGVRSGSLSDILSGIVSDNIWHILTDIIILIYIYIYIYPGNLWHVLWHFMWHIRIRRNTDPPSATPAATIPVKTRWFAHFYVSHANARLVAVMKCFHLRHDVKTDMDIRP